MNIKKAYNYIDNSDRVSSSGTFMNVDLQSLANEGYNAVINLLPDDSEHAVQGEKETFKTLGINYHYIPVDWEAPSLADFEMFEAAMQANQEGKLHIHCAANYRATAFYGMYAYKHLDWEKEKVIAFTAQVWELSNYPVWVSFVESVVNDSAEEFTNEL